MNPQIKALYIDTIKKEIRNKTLVFALVFSTISIFIGYSIAKVFMQNGITVNDTTTPIVVTMMFSFLNIWAVIISIFFGVSAVRSDFQNNIIYQYLSFPISRMNYFLVRLVGTWSMVFSFYIYSYGLTYILFYSINKSFTPTGGQIASMLIMGLFTFLYLTLTFIISMFVNRMGAFISMIFISGFITAANSTFATLPFNEYFKDFTVFKFVFMMIHWLLPRLGVISEIGSNLLKGTKTELNYPLELIHVLITGGILLFIGGKILKKKDF